ncbi:Subunit of heteropentameric Replication factor C (RF-C), partial [Coemansia sp. RSA 1821]
MDFFNRPKGEAAKSPRAAAAGERLVPWVEKYRPKNIGEVAAQEQVVQVLRKSLETKNLPHLLFYGPPGTGKTSTILALTRD